MSKRGSAESVPSSSPVPWLIPDGDDTVVAVLVVSRASRTAVDGEHDGLLRIRVAAPPVDGAANDVLCRFLADRCGVPVRAVSLVSGRASRRKRLRVSGVAPASVLQSLS